MNAKEQSVLEIKMTGPEGMRDYKAELKELSDIFERFVKIEKIDTKVEHDDGRVFHQITIRFQDLPDSEYDLEQANYYLNRQAMIARAKMQQEIWDMFCSEQDEKSEGEEDEKKIQ